MCYFVLLKSQLLRCQYPHVQLCLLPRPQIKSGWAEEGGSAVAPLFGDIMVSGTLTLGLNATLLSMADKWHYVCLQVVAAQGFAALQFILEEKFLGSFRMQVRTGP